MTDNKENEIWKPVVGYEGWYSVSSLGRVRREKSYRGIKAGRILKQIISSRGYSQVNISIPGRRKTLLTHRIVCEAFLGIPRHYEVNHKDFDKRNNNISNLEVVTSSQNKIHAIENNKYPMGENHHGSVLTEDIVRNIRYDYKVLGHPRRKIFSDYDINLSTLKTVLSGKTWRNVR